MRVQLSEYQCNVRKCKSRYSVGAFSILNLNIQYSCLSQLDLSDPRSRDDKAFSFKLRNFLSLRLILADNETKLCACQDFMWKYCLCHITQCFVKETHKKYIDQFLYLKLGHTQNLLRLYQLIHDRNCVLQHTANSVINAVTNQQITFAIYTHFEQKTGE